jgi:hypothetical protein
VHVHGLLHEGALIDQTCISASLSTAMVWLVLVYGVVAVRVRALLHGGGQL